MSVSEHGYLIVIERGRATPASGAPDLPGCVAVGETIDRCERETRGRSCSTRSPPTEGEPVPPAAVAASSWK